MLVDLLLIGACLSGLIHGIWKGASWQLAGFATMAGALVIGRPLSVAIAPLLGEPGAFTGFLAWALSYGSIAFVCFLLAVRVRHRLRDWEMQNWDTHVGGFLGAVNGVLLWAVVMMFVVALVPSTRASVLDRPSGKVLGFTLEALHGVLPDGVHDIVHKVMHPVTGEHPTEEKHEENGEHGETTHDETKPDEHGEEKPGEHDETKPEPKPGEGEHAPTPTPEPGGDGDGR